jgi:hypothetical protein
LIRYTVKIKVNKNEEARRWLAHLYVFCKGGDEDIGGRD